MTKTSKPMVVTTSGSPSTLPTVGRTGPRYLTTVEETCMLMNHSAATLTEHSEDVMDQATTSLAKTCLLNNLEINWF